VTAKTTITCDRCGADITTTDSMPAFTIKLSSERRPHRTDAHGMASVNAVVVDPWPREPKHFCGRACLVAWVGWPSEVSTP
jgi:hypothetical protein